MTVANKETRIACPPALDRDSGKALLDQIRAAHPARSETVVLDLAGTERMDTLGGAWLVAAARHCGAHQIALRVEGQHGAVAELFAIIAPSLTSESAAPRKAPGFVEALGESAIHVWIESRQFLELCVDALYWTIVAPIEGKGFRWGLFIDEIHEMGVRAVQIVCLMNFLLGLIIAMLSSAQVAAFGLTIYVADLIMIGFARELAAIMTATVVSARTGAAIAAEIATMTVQEEIDALRGMGINVAQYLVAPKMAALLVVLPCLVALGLVSGLLGGAAWGVYVLDFKLSVWWTETSNAAHLGDLFQGSLKTFVFAVGIALIGCHNGLRVTGGSRGVGLMTTRAVVMDIFMLITVDIVFATIFYYILG